MTQSSDATPVPDDVYVPHPAARAALRGPAMLRTIAISLLALLAIMTLVLKSLVEWRAGRGGA